MAKKKEFKIILPDLSAIICIMLEIEKKNIVHFCINLVLEEGGKFYDVYRVDTFHGFLHEQRFWKFPRKIKLDMDYTHAFLTKRQEVEENCERWIKLFKKAKKVRN